MSLDSVNDTSGGRDIYTWSRLTSSMACPRKAYLRYGLGWRRSGKPGKALRIGSAFHDGLDYLNTVDETTFDCDTLEGLISEQVDDAFEGEYVLALLTAYQEHYKTDGIEIVASELQFQVEIDSQKIAGAIDAIVRLPDGRLMVVERKTTSDDITPGGEYWWAVRINEQVSLYMVAARQLGYEVSGVLWDAIRKPAQRPSVAKKETPEEYGLRVANVMADDPHKFFQRHELVRTEDQLAKFERDVSDMVFSNWWSRDTTYRNTTHCRLPGRVCPFLDICDRDWNPKSEVPSGYERLDWIHSELIPSTETES